MLNSSQFNAIKDADDKKPKRELGLMEDGNSWLYAITIYWQSLKCAPQAEFSDEANQTRKDMFATVEKLRKKVYIFFFQFFIFRNLKTMAMFVYCVNIVLLNYCSFISDFCN